MSSVASQDRPTLEELAPIRTQGLVGIVLMLITLGSMTYHARPADTNVHQNIADSTLVALENAKADLQTLFNTTSFEHNLTLLRRLTTFGRDFIPAWMIFILFLHRALAPFWPGSRRYFLESGLILMGTLVCNSLIASALDKADHQAVVTDATLYSIYLVAEVKWTLFFFDACMCGLCIKESPSIVRIGAMILMAASFVGMVCVAIPYGVVMPYVVLGVFFGFTGLSILLLFHPELLYLKRVVTPYQRN